MSLEEYDRNIAPHLHFIEAGAAMAERHARALLQKPGFETIAEDELSKIRETLQSALTKIVIAQNAYRDAPAEA
jgi:hypothetical protein